VLGTFGQLIEIAPTLGGKGPIPRLQAAYKRTKSHMTIAIIVAWLTVAMIYLMATTERRKRYY
jgi:hypothetical protein